MSQTWFDTHCHLGICVERAAGAAEFGDSVVDAEWIVARARAAGVTHMLDVGIDLLTSTAAAGRAHALEGVWFSAGLHPNETAVFAAEFDAIAALARDPRCVAIGETGLDFHWDRGPRELQERSFHAHLELAEQLDKPVVVHCRDAMEATLGLLAEHPAARKIMHCFAGNTADAARAIELGCWISFAGPLTYPKSDALRGAARAVPAERLLCETDAPFLPPQSRRGKANEPACVVETAQRLAVERGLDVAELARITSRNAMLLFGLGQRGGTDNSTAS